MRRRHLLTGAASAAAGLSATAAVRPWARALAQETELVAFSEDWLKDRVRALAREDRAAPTAGLPEALASLGSDDYRAIRFRDEAALWQDAGLAFQLGFMHRGAYYARAVEIYEVVDGVAHPVAFSPDLFAYDDSGLADALTADVGFAGISVRHHADLQRDLAAFIAEGSVRAAGAQQIFGPSARALALDTAVPRGEQFPFFRSFWLERPVPGQEQLVVHALLDSDSAVGAYRFVVAPGRSLIVDVDAFVILRRRVERLGLAPIAAMYAHGENDRRLVDDVRPEVHTADGLALCTGSGEWIWRPLVNPSQLSMNAFFDENPRGFGLLQRDRDFASYQDDRRSYHRVPNVWIEPRSPLGRGLIQLIEIPTNSDRFDNVVAFWTPEAAADPGTELEASYRLFWGEEMPERNIPVATVAATRVGRTTLPGEEDRQDRRRFVVDFVGGPLTLLSDDAPVEPVITMSRGELRAAAARLVHALDAWRVEFDVAADGGDPVNLRCYLRIGDRALTETWVYQWHPG